MRKKTAVCVASEDEANLTSGFSLSLAEKRNLKVSTKLSVVSGAYPRLPLLLAHRNHQHTPLPNTHRKRKWVHSVTENSLPSTMPNTKTAIFAISCDEPPTISNWSSIGNKLVTWVDSCKRSWLNQEQSKLQLSKLRNCYIYLSFKNWTISYRKKKAEKKNKKAMEGWPCLAVLGSISLSKTAVCWLVMVPA